jgi:hypothetical protein
MSGKRELEGGIDIGISGAKRNIAVLPWRNKPPSSPSYKIGGKFKQRK